MTFWLGFTLIMLVSIVSGALIGIYANGWKVGRCAECGRFRPMSGLGRQWYGVWLCGRHLNQSIDRGRPKVA